MFRNPDVPIIMTPGGGSPSFPGNGNGDERCNAPECDECNKPIALTWQGRIAKYSSDSYASAGGAGGSKARCLDLAPDCEMMEWCGRENVEIGISLLKDGISFPLNIDYYNFVDVIPSGNVEGQEYTIRFNYFLGGSCTCHGLFTSKIRDPHIHIEATYLASEYCPIENEVISFVFDAELDVIANTCSYSFGPDEGPDEEYHTHCGDKHWVFQKIQ